MPWWIWPILVLFMLAMIAAGLVYAGLHGFHAVQDIAEIGGRLGERVSKWGSPAIPQRRANRRCSRSR